MNGHFQRERMIEIILPQPCFDGPDIDIEHRANTALTGRCQPRVAADHAGPMASR